MQLGKSSKVSSVGNEVLKGESAGLVGGVTSSAETVAGALTPSTVTLPPDWKLSERTLCDLEMLLSGALSPLTGFMTETEYYSVLNDMKLPSGSVWSMPIVLPIPIGTTTPNFHWTESPAKSDPGAPIIKLRDSVGTVVGNLHVESIYQPNLTLEMKSVLGTTDSNHPYVKYLSENHDNCYYVGGRVEAANPVVHHDFSEYRFSPSNVKEILKSQNLSTVVGFQTRNPMHCSHFELVMQCLRQVKKDTGNNPCLLLTPAGGPTQPGDIDFPIRVQCYKKIVKRFEKEGIKVILVLLPLAMRMAGPREALWHAQIRKNYGCTHFIVGRDHAGPSTRTIDNKPFYHQYAAHELLVSVTDDIHIAPVFGTTMFYVKDKGYFQEGNVPKGEEIENISGTELRRKLTERENIPDWYSFPEIVEELRKFYKPLHESGFVLYFTGLPCAGKSALANAVKAKLQENDNERRNISLLDADIVREHLSKGLGFSPEDRSVNVRRIGYVASEIAKHGGIALVANIAPYEKDRNFNRQFVNSQGGKYIEVYVSTPLDVCESRDVKDLFKKARLGVVQQFTGISDPYDVPNNPEIQVNSSTDMNSVVHNIMKYLQDSKYII